MILNQFVNPDGRMMLPHETQLCKKSYRKVQKLIKLAQSAMLMPRSPEYECYGPWDNLNHYYEFPKRIRDKPKSIIKREYWK